MEKTKSYLSFKIGKEFYAASVRYVHNIIEHTRITQVPEMPVYMLGIINLRGRVLPVIDARIKFGIPDTEITTNTCILVMEVEIEDEQVFIGTLVDSVSEVIEIADEVLMPPPNLGAGVKNDYISAVYHNEDHFIMILDMNRVFSDTEIISLNKTVSEIVG